MGTKWNIPLGERVRDGAAIDQRTGCWNWTKYVTPQGYGRISVGRKMIQAHRASYLVFKGDVPAGLEVDHLCRNRRCVNPQHLEAVTRQENVLRGTSPIARQAQQSHCKRGHPFDSGNTYHYRGTRICKTCRAAYTAARR